MVQVIFVSAQGQRQTFDGDVGQSVMEVARRNGVDGIIGECGGCAACATCHVHVDADWLDRVGAPSADEADMLDFAHGRRPDSRLSCQIRLRPGLDGLIVRLPGRQGS